MKFRQYLLEQKSGIPKTFRVVIDIEYQLENHVISQLKHRKLKGLKGISDQGDIIFQFLGVGRDAMLLMNGSEVIKNNKIIKIEYGNPSFMLADNMKFLRRVWNKSANDNRGTLFNLAEYLFNEILRDFREYEFDIRGNAPYQTMADKNNTGIEINNVNDLIKWWENTVEIILQQKNDGYGSREKWLFNELKEKITKDKLKKYITGIFNQLQKVYSDEGEWSIENDTLIVPKNSWLYILVPSTPKNVLDDFNKGKETLLISMRYKDAIERYYRIKNLIEKNRLNKIYKIKWIDVSEWEKIRKIHYSKR